MLTVTEQRMFEFVAGYIQDTGGVSPSYTEIMQAMRLPSKSQIGFMLDGLERKGKIKRLGRRARAIEIIDPHAPKPIVRYPRARFFKFDDDTKELKPWPSQKLT